MEVDENDELDEEVSLHLVYGRQIRVEQIHIGRQSHIQTAR